MVKKVKQDKAQVAPQKEETNSKNHVEEEK